MFLFLTNSARLLRRLFRRARRARPRANLKDHDAAHAAVAIKAEREEELRRSCEVAEMRKWASIKVSIFTSNISRMTWTTRSSRCLSRTAPLLCCIVMRLWFRCYFHPRKPRSPGKSLFYYNTVIVIDGQYYRVCCSRGTYIFWWSRYNCTSPCKPEAWNSEYSYACKAVAGKINFLIFLFYLRNTVIYAIYACTVPEVGQEKITYGSVTVTNANITVVLVTVYGPPRNLTPLCCSEPSRTSRAQQNSVNVKGTNRSRPRQRVATGSSRRNHLLGAGTSITTNWSCWRTSPSLTALARSNKSHLRRWWVYARAPCILNECNIVSFFSFLLLTLTEVDLFEIRTKEAGDFSKRTLSSCCSSTACTLPGSERPSREENLKRTQGVYTMWSLPAKFPYHRDLPCRVFPVTSKVRRLHYCDLLLT